MLFNKFQEYKICERCWDIYNIILSSFEIDADLFVQLHKDIEIALLTGLLNFRLEIGNEKYELVIQEEYDFPLNEIKIFSYSYVLLNINKKPIIWADPSPHHTDDYRGKPIASFPHHLHDSKGRICSFTGELKDFLNEILHLN